ncbi:MAG: hypothetical protein JM58_05155 [Peptococcaceae bacterium BICA1-8]|nr:MAG: hypothetical protein JM58_05155 [Peptococcaceae bacterium BICA1-8]
MDFRVVQLEEAQDILLNTIKTLGTEEATLEQASGRVLSENIYACINVPSFRRSPLDGFAVRASDTLGAFNDSPRSIKIVDEVQAGDMREIHNLPVGCGAKIMTGAPLPHEADAVIKKEDVVYQNNEIKLYHELRVDSNIVFIGSDIKKGEMIFSQGEILSPYHIGVLASLGLRKIKVYRQPKVAILSTGDELVESGDNIRYGQIYNSNLPSLAALINELGGKAFSLGIVPDDILLIEQNLKYAIENYDLIITTGGASVGDYDLIEQALKNIGANILFNRVHIKPGSPVIAGIINKKTIIGLSGNPAAALISFELIVGPLINKLRGIEAQKHNILYVQLEDGFNKGSNQRRFLRVNISYKNGKWIAKQTGKQESSILRSMVGCNGLIDIPQGTGSISPGTIVKAILLR